MAETETLNNPADSEPPVEEGSQPPAESTSVLETPEAASQVPADWPADWRQKLAGDDEKMLKHLERLQSPADLHKSYRELEKKLSTAKTVDELPEDATEEDVQKWRERNGVPLDPKGYLENLPGGLVFSEEDEGALEGFLSRMHGSNVSPKVVQESLKWYKEFQEEQVTQQVEADREYRKVSEDNLRAEWGPEYRANVNSIKNFLSVLPEGLGGSLMAARLGDGSLLSNNPQALSWFLQMANDANPAGFIAPSTGGDQLTGVQQRLDEIRTIRKKDATRYFSDEKMQAEFRKLLEAEERLASRQ